MKFLIIFTTMIVFLNQINARVARAGQSVWEYQQLLQELQDKLNDEEFDSVLQDPIVTDCPAENTGFQLISEWVFELKLRFLTEKKTLNII